MLNYYRVCRLAEGKDTAVAWVRAHIGIPGNEEAETLATWHSYRGQIACTPRTATEGPRMPLRRSHPTNRHAHHLLMPTTPTPEDQTTSRKQQLGRGRQTHTHQGRRERIRGRSNAFHFIPFRLPHPVSNQTLRLALYLT